MISATPFTPSPLSVIVAVFVISITGLTVVNWVYTWWVEVTLSVWPGLLAVIKMVLVTPPLFSACWFTVSEAVNVVDPFGSIVLEVDPEVEVTVLSGALRLKDAPEESVGVSNGVIDDKVT